MTKQNTKSWTSSFRFRHSFVIKHSTIVISLALVAQGAHAGLEKYSSLILADKYPFSEPEPKAIRVTYLGVNGFQFETGGHAMLVDPYFTRGGFWPAALNQRIASNPARVNEGLKHLHPHPDAILVTHAHFDHLLDVPEIMKHTGARLLSGPTAIELVESMGISPNQCLVVRPGTARVIGPWKIHVLPAQHDRLFGKVPFEKNANPVKRPIKASDWSVGEPLAFIIEASGKRIYVDSGGIPGARPGAEAGHVDLAILGVALSDSRKRVAEVVRQLQPRYILPSHQDDMFAAFSRGFTFGKLTNFPELVRLKAKQQLPGHLILLDYFRPWTLP
jgi:L-ascorbate metabolism protein UlaG (beta-lactamase superfamily)